ELFGRVGPQRLRSVDSNLRVNRTALYRLLFVDCRFQYQLLGLVILAKNAAVPFPEPDLCIFNRALGKTMLPTFHSHGSPNALVLQPVRIASHREECSEDSRAFLVWHGLAHRPTLVLWVESSTAIPSPRT